MFPPPTLSALGKLMLSFHLLVPECFYFLFSLCNSAHIPMSSPFLQLNHTPGWFAGLAARYSHYGINPLTTTFGSCPPESQVAGLLRGTFFNRSAGTEARPESHLVKPSEWILFPTKTCLMRARWTLCVDCSNYDLAASFPLIYRVDTWSSCSYIQLFIRS